jgi:hypothetical protein
MISKEELEKINQIEGEIIGHSLREDFEFIKMKKGKEGLEKIEKALREMGFSLKRSEIKFYQWYPWKNNILLLVLAQKIFNWDEETFREWGRFNAKISFLAKLIMRFFVSLEKLIEGAPIYWKRYFTRGELEIKEVNKKERYIILDLKDFPTHPLFCRELEGYFWQIISYVLPKENLKVKEIECPFQGGKIHKFQISW